MARLGLAKPFRNDLPFDSLNPKALSPMMENPHERQSQVIRSSTTAGRWSIRRITSVANVCLPLLLLSAPVDRMPGRNTGYKSFDPSHPCRKCWDKYSKPYSGPIVYTSWNEGPSNRQRPLLNIRPSAANPSLSFSRSLSSIVNQARNDLYSFPGNSPRHSHPPPPPPSFPVPRPFPSRPQSGFITTSANRSPSPAWSRNGPSPPAVLRPGDPGIGGTPCWNCLGSGRTFGFLLLTNNTCDLCGGIGRLF